MMAMTKYTIKYNSKQKSNLQALKPRIALFHAAAAAAANKRREN